MTHVSSLESLELIKLEMRSKESKVVRKEMAYDKEEQYAQDNRRACADITESDVVGDSVTEGKFG